MKLHLIAAIVTTVIVSVMAITEKDFTRYILLIPSIILLKTTMVCFSVEYDKKMMKLWKEREKKIHEEAYLGFVEEYYKKNMVQDRFSKK